MKMIFPFVKRLEKGWFLAFLLAFFSQTSGFFAQTECTAPTAVCDALTQIVAGPSGGVTISASLVAEDSYIAACPLVTFGVRTQGTLGAFATVINLLSPGIYALECQFTAPNGNQNICWGNVEVLAPSGPCSPDVTPPVPVCNEFLTIQSNLNGPDMTLVTADLLDVSSYDDCSAVHFRVSVDITPLPPATTSVPLVGVGDHVVYLWAIDAANNFNTCATLVTTIAPKCSPDKTAPTLLAPANLTFTQAAFSALGPIDYTNSAAMNAAFGAPFDWDNCDNAAATVIESYQLELSAGGALKKITRSFGAFDAAGNSNFNNASQTITITQTGYTFHVPAWHLPGNLGPVDTMSFVAGGFQLAKTYTDQVFEFTCDTVIDRTLRTWSLIDWGGSVPGAQPFTLPAKDINGDSQTGDAYEILVLDGALYRVENGQSVEILGNDHQGLFSYEQEIRTSWFDLDQRVLKVIVFLDSTENCTFDASEKTLVNWPVKGTGLVSGKIYSSLTNASGFVKFTALCPSDTTIEVSLDLPFDYGQECGTTFLVNILPNSPHLLTIPVRLETACNLLTVDIATPKIRPCQTSVYHVSYCNLGSDSVPNASVQVDLDAQITVLSASIPHVNQPPNSHIFALGTLAAGECGNFTITFSVDCDAAVGATFCATATISPEDLCGGAASWSGAFLTVKGRCDGDSVRFEVKNVGSAHMTDPLEYIVVEDLIMRVGTSPVQLEAAETMEIALDATAAAYRLEMPQVAGAPFDLFAFSTVEGCGGINQTGLVNVFSMQTQSPFNSTFCLESVASFDPNDKKALPTGYGSEHFIRATDDLDYLIRFQNTGSDTAFRVVILDTLSTFLDEKMVRPGASSHAFDFDILDGNVLRFAFEKINLPDSTTNFDASQGFVKFTVAQKSGNQNGTIISNRAAIFFDQNAAILTNTENRKIGSGFILTSLDAPKNGLEKCRVWPNPTSGALFFEFPKNLESGLFELTDVLGRTVFSQKISGKTARIDVAGQPSGLYFFKINDHLTALFSGTISVE